ncbi:MAG TPA: hypothetical protein DIW50_18085 [Prolixibacteraceae bacterium]|nr:hypothetical protein [Prolixibacteraceae bacterium]
MKCNQLKEYIGSEVSYNSVAEHLYECKICSGRLEQINQCMSLLDENVEVPEDLVAKTLRKMKDVKFPPRPGIDYSKYLQLAAVIVAGIFLGIVLGRNANTELFLSKKGKKDRALIEYRESHHLSEPGSIYRF